MTKIYKIPDNIFTNETASESIQIYIYIWRKRRRKEHVYERDCLEIAFKALVSEHDSFTSTPHNLSIERYRALISAWRVYASARARTTREAQPATCALLHNASFGNARRLCARTGCFESSRATRLPIASTTASLVVLGVQRAVNYRPNAILVSWDSICRCEASKGD